MGTARGSAPGTPTRGIQNAPAGGPSQLTAYIPGGGLLTGCDEDAPRSPRRAGIPMRGFDRFRVSSTERDFPLTQEHDWVRGDTVAVNTKLKNSQLNTPATALRSSALDSCAQSCSNWPWPSCAATDRTKELERATQWVLGEGTLGPGWAGPLLASVPGWPRRTGKE